MIIPNRYESTKRVINGGLGSVTIYEDRHLKRLVAIKSIKNRNEVHRIKDELDALLALRSKHVVQVYDLIYEQNVPVGIVEEYISGQDLCDSTMPQQSSESYLRALWQISSGIADVHSFNVIHRDIKPNNMMYDEEGIIKIFDFGLSRQVGEKARTIGFKGTFEFSAPEQFGQSINNEVHFTQAVDVYAFGIMAIYLVDRSLPSVGFDNSRWNVFNASMKNKLSFLPSSLQELLESCINVDPGKRPKMSLVRDSIAKNLLKDKHQAIAVLMGEPKFLNKDKKRVQMGMDGIGSIEILYDGFRFYVKNVSGEVYINNIPVNIDHEIPGSCVVTIGAPSRHYSNRAFIPFDVSHPEVVL